MKSDTEIVCSPFDSTTIELNVSPVFGSIQSPEPSRRNQQFALAPVPRHGPNFGIAENANPHGFRTSAMQVITKAVGIENWRELIPSDVVRRLYITPITKMATLVSHAASAQHLFKEAFEEKDVTAWVCANDDLAIAAWQFLQKHKEPRARSDYPPRITVTGEKRSTVIYRIPVCSRRRVT